jgi:hypothetical protein
MQLRLEPDQLFVERAFVLGLGGMTKDVLSYVAREETVALTRDCTAIISRCRHAMPALTAYCLGYGAEVVQFELRRPYARHDIVRNQKGRSGRKP